MSLTFWMTVGIFVVAYALIVSERINSTVTAIAGAVVMILLGVVTQERALEGIDFNTLGLLIGMMLIVGIARHSGMFQFVAIWASRLGKGKPIPIFLLLGIITAVFSAFLDNVTTVLLMTPVAFVVANNLRINPKPFLLSSILLSNIGGTATLIGDPPNILIGSSADISFNEFALHMAPIAILVSVVTLALLYWWYRGVLVSTDENAAAIMKFNPREAITDWPLLVKSLIVLGLVLLGFFTHVVTHYEVATVAMAGAALLLILTLKDPEHHLKDIEWVTIFFFIGLFVLVMGLEEVGAIQLLAENLVSATQGNPTVTTLVVLWGSGLFSAVINNIPFVATMIPLIKDIGTLTGMPLAPLWWALALGADIGGNATIVGASANVVVNGMAEREGHGFTFFEYMKIAAPLTVVALLICTAYIYFRYLL